MASQVSSSTSEHWSECCLLYIQAESFENKVQLSC
ncbi:hypothetical protein LEMLEM_LOCUS19940 [Lemmus lemmus]